MGGDTKSFTERARGWRRILTHFPIHLVKDIVLWGVIYIPFCVLDRIDSHLLHRHHDAGIVQQVPEAKVPPPHRVAVGETRRRGAGGDEGVDGTRGAGALARLVPCPREGVSTFGEFGVELRIHVN